MGTTEEAIFERHIMNIACVLYADSPAEVFRRPVSVIAEDIIERLRGLSGKWIDTSVTPPNDRDVVILVTYHPSWGDPADPVLARFISDEPSSWYYARVEDDDEWIVDVDDELFKFFWLPLPPKPEVAS